MKTELTETIIKQRDKIADSYMWDLTSIFKSAEEWEKEFGELENAIPLFDKFKGSLDVSATRLLEALEFNDSIGIKFGRLFLYAMLNRDIDLTDTKFQALHQKVVLMSSKIEAAASYIRSEIVRMSADKISTFLKDEKKLETYRHYLFDLLRTKQHTLSEEKEQLLAKAEPALQVPYETFNLFTNADIVFPSFEHPGIGNVEISHAGYSVAMYSDDREYREKYYKSYYKPFVGNKNTLSVLFNGNLRSNIFNSGARNYSSTLESSLDIHNIPLSVYDNLVDSVAENLAPLHRWCALRKEILGVNDFHAWDTYVNMFPADKKTYTYDEGVDIVMNALAVLGDEYISNLKMAFENRWIDVFESRGKRSGAYSSGVTFGVHPFILLNWGYQLSDVFILAHELGHNMHSHFTGQTQPFPYANYSIFVGEVTSTLNEALVRDFLIKQSDSKSEKLSLIEERITSIVTTFYRQTMFAAFEKEVHQRAENSEALTPDILCAIYGDLHRKYWGPNMFEDEEEKYTWARIPHFYYNFYVYQYATSLAASEILSERILNDGDVTVNQYIDMLKAGSSDYAIDLLKKAGVDMTMNKPILSVAEKMNSLLDEMENLL